MARVPDHAGLAPLDAESAETAEFNLRLPLHGPRNRVQHGVKHLFRLPGSGFASQFLPQFLNEFRVKDAQRLLKETDASIQNIFEESGFNSITTFNRVFKELSGDSPTEYRARFRM